jgi:SAM-dependent methyltransferase
MAKNFPVGQSVSLKIPRMKTGRLLFELFYRFGFTPWEGHKLPSAMTSLVEKPAAFPPGRALDIGCGTGDASIYLARHGWTVTAIDFVPAALNRARKKADAAGVNIRFLQADATKLTSYGLGDNFRLFVDNGCLHGLSDDGRDSYVRAVTTMAAPGARLILAGFLEGKRRGPRGFNQAEVEKRFAPQWELLSSGVDQAVSNDPGDPIAVYHLRRR